MPWVSSMTFGSGCCSCWSYSVQWFCQQAYSPTLPVSNYLGRVVHFPANHDSNYNKVINESTLITSTIDASESAPNEANSTPSRSRKTRDPAAISSSSLLAVSTMAVTGVSTFGNGLPETIPESQKAFCTSSISADYSSWMSSNFGKMTTKPYTAYDIVTWPGENSFSITSVSVTDTVYQTWMPDRVSECFCDLCYVGAEYVQLLAWPPSPTTKRAEPPITSFVSEGYTLYVHFARILRKRGH